MSTIVYVLTFIKCFLTSNPIFRKGATIVPKGIMVHSTGTKGVKAPRWIEKWNVLVMVKKKLVHAFVDDTGVYQTCPWNMKAAHAGGSANGSYIGFEICEPKDYNDKAYFENVKDKAIKLCAYLCKLYSIKPSMIITHCEGYRKGIASNHADIDHWWKKYFGYTMDNFRRDVELQMKAEASAAAPQKKANPYSYPNRVLKYVKGSIMKGSDVKWLQFELLEAGIKTVKIGLKTKKVEIDGSFGPITEAATKVVQKIYGLEEDGKCGPITKKTLKEV